MLFVEQHCHRISLRVSRSSTPDASSRTMSGGVARPRAVQWSSSQYGLFHCSTTQSPQPSPDGRPRGPWCHVHKSYSPRSRCTAEKECKINQYTHTYTHAHTRAYTRKHSTRSRRGLEGWASVLLCCYFDRLLNQGCWYKVGTTSHGWEGCVPHDVLRQTSRSIPA